MNPYIGVDCEGRHYEEYVKGDIRFFPIRDLRKNTPVKMLDIHTIQETAAIQIKSLITQATLGDNQKPYTLTARTDMNGDVFVNRTNKPEMVQDVSSMSDTTIL